MDLLTIVMGIATILTLTMYLAAMRQSGISRLEARFSIGSPVVSQWVLCAPIVVLPFFWVGRDDPAALIEQGLSTYNLATVFFAIVAGVWSAFLIGRGQVALRTMLSGPRLFFLLLVTYYAVTTAWSFFPAFTAYRVFELLAYTIVMVHLFYREKGLEVLYSILRILLLARMLTTVDVAFMNIMDGRYFTFVLSNTYSVLSAVFLFMYFTCPLHGDSVRKRRWDLLLGIYIFMASGSTATTYCLILAVLCYITIRGGALMRIFGTTALVIGIIGFFMLMYAPTQFKPIVEFASFVLQKDTRAFFSGTGRFTIWDLYWESTKNVPFGRGFAAGDRFAQIILNIGDKLPIQVSSAHNVWLTAWMGGGWPAVLLLLSVYVSGYVAAFRILPAYRPMIISIALLLTLNSITAPGVGTYFGVMMIPWMAVICTPIAREYAMLKKHARFDFHAVMRHQHAPQKMAT